MRLSLEAPGEKDSNGTIRSREDLLDSGCKRLRAETSDGEWKQTLRRTITSLVR